MKLIRMLKTMAGPAGTFAPGQLRTVEDDLADLLVGAEAAEVVQTIAEAEMTAVLMPDVETTAVEPAAEMTAVLMPDVETTAVEPAAETAALETATARRRVKK